MTNHKFQPNHNDQNSKFQTGFGHLILALWNFALGEPAEGRIPQGENLKFVCNLKLGVWDFFLWGVVFTCQLVLDVDSMLAEIYLNA